MEVIRKGKLSKTKTAICPKCEALLKYNGKDIKTDYQLIDIDNRGDCCIHTSLNIRYITCPECEEKIILSKSTENYTLPNLIG